MDLELTGKAAIITGGSRGIGRAIALQLASEGVDVALVARNQEPLDTAAREIAAKTGRRIIGVVADTASNESVRTMVATVMKEFGHIDILVNGAAKPGGQAPPPKLNEITDDLFFDDINVKVMGYLRCAREVSPHMIDQGWGRIISLSGLAARSAGTLIGGIRNVAVVTMTKNLAEELGPSGINVTVVHPGRVRTEAVDALLRRQAEQRGVDLAEVEHAMAAGNSVRRIIRPEDIANVVAFLASPKSVAINGDVIAAGGGVGKGIFY